MIRVYGSSDDLIEVDGDWSEEFNVDSRQAYYVATDGGRLIRIYYDREGNWRIDLIDGFYNDAVVVEPFGNLGLPNDYSDVALIEANEWAVCGPAAFNER